MQLMKTISLWSLQKHDILDIDNEKMFDKTFVILKSLVIFLLYNIFIFSSELPTELLGFQLGDRFKNIKSSVQLKKIKSSFKKVYKVVYTEEEQSIETELYFFNKKIYKIVVCYPEKIFNEDDWENIYNQASSMYNKPQKVIVTQQNGILKETYLWENQEIKYMYKKINKDNRTQNFSIELVDKLVEQKMSQMSFIKKLYFTIINFF